MDSFIILIAIGLLIGTFGTLIGAGGGFLLVPVLLLTYPKMSPDIVTAISMAIVAVNAISGSFAYAYSSRIDYKAGLVFAAYTIPGSILGVFATRYIPKNSFNLIFGILLIGLSIYLFLKSRKSTPLLPTTGRTGKAWKHHVVTDREGGVFSYTYNQTTGIAVSVIVGFLSPLLGIGGGIIHVPAMVQWLQFPVYIATATSHFILAIMSTVSVGVHFLNGDYNNAEVSRIVLALVLGVIPGAQLGAFLSHKISTGLIIKILAVCLALVGVRIIAGNYFA